MKPFTIWTNKVRYKRMPVNGRLLGIVISVTDSIHDSGWVGLQDTTGNCTLFSHELSKRNPNRISAEFIYINKNGYIVT